MQELIEGPEKLACYMILCHLQAGQGLGTGGRMGTMLARSWDGFRVIGDSGYLTHLSLYIVLSTVIASLMYFEKSMVRSPGSSFSMSFADLRVGRSS